MGPGASSSKALHHMSETFALVNKRLQGEHALDDSTLALVISLINQEQIRNEQKGAKIHIDGLKRIVGLRGGLKNLERANVPLVLKICK